MKTRTKFLIGCAIAAVVLPIYWTHCEAATVPTDSLTVKEPVKAPTTAPTVKDSLVATANDLMLQLQQTLALLSQQNAIASDSTTVLALASTAEQDSIASTVEQEDQDHKDNKAKKDKKKKKSKYKFEVHGSVGFVSDYVWRGAYQGSGVSVQPSLTMGIAGFYINAWGNQSITKPAKEFDINIGYQYKGFNICISDYWWAGEDKSYGDYANDHFFEATLGYTVSEKYPFTISWSTMFAGGDKDENGKLQASTYIYLGYTFNLPYDIDLGLSLGFTPWKGIYYEKAAVTDINIKASKTFHFGKHFELPIFIQAIVAPMYDRTYLVGGFSIGF